jgi:hypothetical protein
MVLLSLIISMNSGWVEGRILTIFTNNLLPRSVWNKQSDYSMVENLQDADALPQK